MILPSSNSPSHNKLTALLICITVVSTLIASDSKHAFGNEYPGDCEMTRYVIVGGPWTTTGETSYLFPTWELAQGLAYVTHHEEYPLGTTYSNYYVNTEYFQDGRWWYHYGGYHAVVTPGEGQYSEDLSIRPENCGGIKPCARCNNGPPGQCMD